MPLLNRDAANTLFDWLMPRITNLHHLKLFMVAVIACCLIALWRGPRRIKIGILCALIAVGLSDSACSRVIKPIAPRYRPCRLVRGGTAFPQDRLAPETECPGSSSFPSNHSSNMMALGLVGWWFTRGRIRWLWFLLPLVIGYSRIYLGFHYPTDVLGGWLLGAMIGGFIIAIVRARLSEPLASSQSLIADSADHNTEEAPA
jgi:undecaprenyl-diphosphatase